MPKGRLLHFRVGPRRVALALSDVMEICELQRIATVPGAPTALARIADIRGRIVTLVDLQSIGRDGWDQDLGPGTMALQFNEPFSHLAVRIEGGVQDLEIDYENERPEALPRDPERESSARASETGAAAWDPGPASLTDFGREIVLSTASPAILLDVAALAVHCSLLVRARFRVAG